MQEIWKDISGYEGLYRVSNLGKVESLRNNIILKQSPTKDGYLAVGLCNGKTKTCRAHRLVAIAFIPNPDNLPEVNHIDGNKTNNSVDNLEWVTPLENTHHAIRTGLIPDGFYQGKGKHVGKWMEKNRSKPVRQIKGEKVIATYASAAKAGEALGNKWAFANISSCCHGRIPDAYGYKWEFAS